MELVRLAQINTIPSIYDSANRPVTEQIHRFNTFTKAVVLLARCPTMDKESQAYAEVFNFFMEMRLDQKVFHDLCKHAMLTGCTTIQALEQTYLEYKQLLLENNKRLVWFCLKRYVGRGLSTQDMFQEGCTGLLRALDLFDPSRDTKLATYAVWWIKWTIMKAIYEQGRVIALPTQRSRQIAKLMSASKDYLQEHGTEAPVGYLATELGIPPTLVEELLQLTNPTLSLDFQTEDSTTLLDVLAAPVCENTLDMEIGKKALAVALAALPDRSRQILQLRFGLTEDEMPRSLSQVSALYSLSKERVRQIEAEAILQLRRSGNLALLKGYLVALQEEEAQ